MENVQVAQTATQDGDSDMGSPAMPLDEQQRNEYLTKDHFEQAIEAMSAKLIQTWQSTADQIKKEVRDLSNRTLSVEAQCQDLTTTQTELSDHIQILQQKVEEMEIRMADYEDRARRNNLRLRGVPESVQPDDLQLYVRGLMSLTYLRTCC
ncbi:Hypothetical predicted protein [Pelobates cultripes]|uniref:Uncharacterized protein n=1 Tax=Pelobates cultripes TaxID=61616 RepID=A0AAD1RBG2_PELCU|nr:Hypothetical predicted protein [Pelobates cultripes]